MNNFMNYLNVCVFNTFYHNNTSDYYVSEQNSFSARRLQKLSRAGLAHAVIGGTL